MKMDQQVQRKGGPRTPYGKSPTPLSQYLDSRWPALGLTNAEAADRLGMGAPNMISMWRTGQTPVPLARLAGLAALLRVDPAEIYRLWLAQQRDREKEVPADFVELLQRRTVSANEAKVVDALRLATRNADPAFSAEAIGEIVSSLQKS